MPSDEFVYGSIIVVLGWCLTGVIAYRFGLRSKKKDLIVPIINEIRDAARDYMGHVFESIDYKTQLKTNPPQKGQIYMFKGFFNLSPDNLTKDIDNIINRNGHILNWYKKAKIRSKFKKIAKLSIDIIKIEHWDDKIKSDKKKRFYKYLDSIGVYD
jgi:hypothetical protein